MGYDIWVPLSSESEYPKIKIGTYRVVDRKPIEVVAQYVEETRRQQVAIESVLRAIFTGTGQVLS